MIDVQKLYPAIEPITCYSPGLHEDFIIDLINAGDKLQFMEAKVGSAATEVNVSVRKSNVAWIPADDEHIWIWHKFSEITSQINFDKYNFDLAKITGFQYTTYTEGGFYDWHIDGALSNRSFGPQMRKLGFSLLLSDPEEEFTGGHFEIIPAGDPSQIIRQTAKKGDILAFPSFIPHQVTKVTSGKRKSLVWWVEGPNFR